MKKSKAAKVIERIALKEGVSVTEVRAEMQKAIDAAYVNKDKGDYAKDFWDKWKNRKPTPEEFIVSATADVLDKLFS